MTITGIEYELDMSRATNASPMATVIAGEPVNKPPRAMVTDLGGGHIRVTLSGGVEAVDAAGFDDGDHVFDLPFYPKEITILPVITVSKINLNVNNNKGQDNAAAGDIVTYKQERATLKIVGRKVTLHGVDLTAAAKADAFIIDGISFYC